MPPGQDQYVSLPNGSYVHVPGDATPQQLDQLRTKLSSQYGGSKAESGQPISQFGFGTLRAAATPSLYEQAVSPIRELAGPIIKTFLGDKVSGTEAAPGTWVKNFEGLTQEGRAQHPREAAFGDLFRGARQLGGIIAPEVATLGIPDAGSSIGEGISNIPKAASRLLRNEEGQIAITPSSVLDRVIPQRPEVLERQAEEEMRGKLEAAESSRQKELADQERLREQHARSLNARKEQATEVTPFGGPGVTSTAGIPSSGIPHVPRPVSGIEAGIPQVSSTNPSLDVSLSPPKTIPQVTGAAQKPFEPLIYESPEEANAIDFRNANLKRQASSAGTFHAAQGASGKKLNLQQRIARRYGGTP